MNDIHQISHRISTDHHPKPSSERFEEYFGYLLTTHGPAGISSKYLTLENAAIYINPEGMDILKHMNMPHNKHIKQITAIEHTKFGYAITYMPGVFNQNKPFTFITETVSSIDDIDDDQLDFITLFLPGTGKIIKKLHFRDRLKHACGVGHSQVLSKAVAQVIDNTASQVDIDLSKS